jgi:hypothetical protein
LPLIVTSSPQKTISGVVSVISNLAEAGGLGLFTLFGPSSSEQANEPNITMESSGLKKNALQIGNLILLISDTV